MTALQQLIRIMENGPGYENGFEWRRVAKNLIEVEKEQIKAAFLKGNSMQCGCYDPLTDEDAENYYFGKFED